MGVQYEVGGGGGKKEIRDHHLSLLWSEADSDETYASYNTLGLCFPDTKTKKSKTTTKIMTDAGKK